MVAEGWVVCSGPPGSVSLSGDASKWKGTHEAKYGDQEAKRSPIKGRWTFSDPKAVGHAKSASGLQENAAESREWVDGSNPSLPLLYELRRVIIPGEWIVQGQYGVKA